MHRAAKSPPRNCFDSNYSIGNTNETPKAKASNGSSPGKTLIVNCAATMFRNYFVLILERSGVLRPHAPPRAENGRARNERRSPCEKVIKTFRSPLRLASAARYTRGNRPKKASIRTSTRSMHNARLEVWIALGMRAGTDRTSRHICPAAKPGTNRSEGHASQLVCGLLPKSAAARAAARSKTPLYAPSPLTQVAILSGPGPPPDRGTVYAPTLNSPL